MIVSRLDRLLKERRIPIVDLQRQTGLSYTTLYRLYRGWSRRVDYATIAKLCAALDVQPGDILEYVAAE